MEIYYHANFLKNYRKRISSNQKLIKMVKKKVSLFLKNPSHSLLKDHSLKGKRKEQRAFWITGDYRIVYQKISPSKALFLNIDTHNQVY